MKFITNDWTLKQNNLKKYLSKEQTFGEGIKLLVEMYGLLHNNGVGNNANTIMILYGAASKKKPVE